MIASKFHWFVSRWMRSETRRCWCVPVGGLMGLCGYVVESHGSSQTLISSLLPINQPIPSFKIVLPTIIPRHPWDGFDEREHSIKEELWQYLPTNTRETRIEGALRILYSCFCPPFLSIFWSEYETHKLCILLLPRNLLRISFGSRLHIVSLKSLTCLLQKSHPSRK